MAHWIVRTTDFKSRDLDIPVYECDRSEIFRVSVKRSAKLFGAAILCIFVPVAHFVLVPAFLVIAAVTFFRSLKLKQRLGGNELLCPNCSNKIKLGFVFMADEMRVHCSSCGAQLLITASE